MSEQDVVFSKINIIKNCLFAIERAQDEIKDPDFQLNIFELNLQRAVQASIDMANTVIAKEALGLPNSYRNSFEILSRFQVLPQSLSGQLVKMVGFRDISVHDYEVIKPETVRAIVQHHLKDFEAFYTAIFERIKGWT